MNEEFNNDIEDIEGDEYEVITFTSDDGETMECIVIDSCEREGATYLLVVNAEDADDEDAPADILKEINEGDDNFSYEFIEDDDEFEKIAAIFEEENEDYELK